MVTTHSGIVSSPSHPQLIRKKKTKSTLQTESISGNKKPGSHKHTKKRNSAHVSVPHLQKPNQSSFGAARQVTCGPLD